MAPSNKQGDWDAVRQAVRDILEQEQYDDGSAGPVLVRLAWHASGTYDKESGTGGSNGAGMRYEAEGGDPANAGLQHARVFLEPIKEAFPWISYADLWTLAGVTAIEAMGGPSIPWKEGRTDFVDDTKLPPRGRLPDGAQGSDHLRHVFYRMGFNDQEIVALSGAHNLGRCHEDRSGFEGAWVPNPTRFTNTYFRLLKQLEWKPREWNGPFQFHSDELGADLMMLPTDMALVQDESFRKYVDLYAEDKEKFFEDFSAVFAKLIELGVNREETKYEAAPKKSDDAGAPDSSGDGMATDLAKENKRHQRQEHHGGMHLKSKL